MEPAVGDRVEGAAAEAGGASIRVGAVLQGRYRLAARVAAGGMATIYRGRDQLLDRDVAVKVLHPHLAEDTSLLARFQVEARAAAGLLHPNIVNVFDQGVSGQGVSGQGVSGQGATGLPFIVMEYVDGPSLRDVLRLRHRLPPREALSVLEPVCSALARAHGAGLVHRDIKPENVLVASEDGTVKVADFGIARVLAASRITDSDMLVGSVHYLAPEVVLGDEAGPASDQYAVGLVLFELLTGRKPFAGGSREAVAMRRATEPVPPPSSLVAAVGPELDGVVATATALDPRSRYPDMATFSRALRAAIPAGPSPVLVPGRDETDGTLIIPYGEMETRTLPVSGAAPAAGNGSAEPDEGAAERLRTAPRRALRRARASRLLRAAAAVVALALFAAALVLLPLRRVPELSALSVEEAQAALAAAGLRAGPSRAVASREVAQGAVVDTEPGAGARLPDGATVGLVTSSGPAEVAMPAVVSLRRDEALAVLGAAPYDFEVRVEVAFSDAGVPEGVVGAQSPLPGEPVEEGAVVTLSVSRGPRLVAVPDLRGVPVAQAEGLLAAAGLAGAFRQEYSDVQPQPGLVSAQSPAGGAQIAVGTPVEVVVSLGPATVVLPDLWLQPVADAAAALAELGLVAAVVEQPQPQVGTFLWGQPGLVERQEPAAGTPVTRGQQITLTTWAAPPAGPAETAPAEAAPAAPR